MNTVAGGQGDAVEDTFTVILVSVLVEVDIIVLKFNFLYGVGQRESGVVLRTSAYTIVVSVKVKLGVPNHTLIHGDGVGTGGGDRLGQSKRHVSIAEIDGMRERTIVASGFSKAYAMTGWRLGYLCAPKPLIKQMLKIHQYAIMCAPTTSQFAALEALQNGDDDIEMMRAEYNRRRVVIYDGLKSIGIDSFEPEGAFYIYPDIAPFGLSSDEFAERLLYEKRCAIVPGTAFGECGEGFARISYAYSVKHINEALERIEAFVKSLKK